MNRTSRSLTLATALILPAVSGAAEQWKHPKTPWGDPDLQGMWPIAHLMAVPLQRAKRAQEAAARAQEAGAKK